MADALRALWTLDGLTRSSQCSSRGLEEGSREISLNGVRLAERWLGGSNRAIAAAIHKRIDDPDAAVRRQVAASLGAAAPSVRDAALTAVLERHGDDPIAMDAALSGLRDREAIVLQRLMRAGSDETPQRLAAVTMLAATIVRSANHAAIHQVFALTAEGKRQGWQRSALLRGAEVALLGLAMPGAKRAAPAPIAPNLPCPTCPGGRAGPGGAYAFQRPGDPTIVNRAARRGPALRLNREPLPLTALAASTGDLGARAVTLLAAVAWPGKRGEPVAASLTAAEQQRFEAGREIYRNICQACHQADGRGQDKLAPSLIVSALALANPGIPARILLNGKEGSVGLMPPIGSVLNDDQIAALDRAGAVVWQRHLATENGAFDIQWGSGSSPVVHGDLLILLCDQPARSYLIALDKKTGKDRWKADRGQGRSSYSTPLVIEGTFGAEVIVNSTERIDAYDVKTGAFLWHAGETSRFAVPSPVFHDGVIYASRGYRSGPYMALKPGGRGDVNASKTVWRVATGAPYVSSLLYYDGIVYMANDVGVLTAVDAATGERVWQERVEGVFSASPVAGGGHVYFVSESGDTVVVKGGRQPQIVARNVLGERAVASPAISNGQVFVRTDKHVFAIGR